LKKDKISRKVKFTFNFNFATLQLTMSNFKKISLILLVAVIVILGLLFLVGYFRPEGAGIFIDSSPQSQVFINGMDVGRTPYDAVMEPGEITVKIEPFGENNYSSYETKVNLVSNIKTVIKREFTETDEKSSGEIASFEKIGGKDASVSIVAIPDSAQISLDGQLRGFAPYKITSITPGEHRLVVSAENYQERALSIRAHQGFKLTVVIKLAALEIEPTSTSSPVEEEKLFQVLILDTPNGFLRVRSEPSTDGEEIGRVDSGQTYPFLAEDKETGWFKIEYEEGQEGWVSSDYSQKKEI